MNKNIQLQDLEKLSKDTLMNALDITYTEIGKDFLAGKMPVNHLTKQPLGLLHGGATAALIETLASIGTYMLIDPAKQFAAGLELNVNHLRGMTEGFVFGKATIIHKGRNTHVWQVDIKNEADKLIATGRMTMFVKDKV